MQGKISSRERSSELSQLFNFKQEKKMLFQFLDKYQHL